jgi:hypothetical protein
LHIIGTGLILPPGGYIPFGGPQYDLGRIIILLEDHAPSLEYLTLKYMYQANITFPFQSFIALRKLKELVVDQSPLEGPFRTIPRQTLDLNNWSHCVRTYLAILRGRA